MAMMGVDELFIDTNILVYATDTLSLWHKAAQARLREVHDLGIELIISPQIVREYLSVSTRSSVTTGSPSIAEIVGNIHVFRTQFRVLDNNALVLDNLMELIRAIPVAGKQVHDANIVATMRAYGIPYLLTHNTIDFVRFAHLITAVPMEATA